MSTRLNSKHTSTMHIHVQPTTQTFIFTITIRNHVNQKESFAFSTDKFGFWFDSDFLYQFKCWSDDLSYFRWTNHFGWLFCRSLKTQLSNVLLSLTHILENFKMNKFIMILNISSDGLRLLVVLFLQVHRVLWYGTYN